MGKGEAKAKAKGIKPPVDEDLDAVLAEFGVQVNDDGGRARLNLGAWPCVSRTSDYIGHINTIYALILTTRMSGLSRSRVLMVS